MNAPVVAYVALGANLGDSLAAVRAAMDSIAQLPGTRVTARSSLYRTAPVDAVGPDFVNAVVEVSTHLAPLELLGQLQRLEQEAGRQRPWRHAPRTLDLDLLTHGEVAMATPELTLPHPRMNERAFVLVPLAEIAPQRVSAQHLARVSGQPITRID